MPVSDNRPPIADTDTPAASSRIIRPRRLIRPCRTSSTRWYSSVLIADLLSSRGQTLACRCHHRLSYLGRYYALQRGAATICNGNVSVLALSPLLLAPSNDVVILFGFARTVKRSY